MLYSIWIRGRGEIDLSIAVLKKAIDLREKLNRNNVLLDCLVGSFTNDNDTNTPSLLCEKYTNLAREALSNGDKILSENYFQYADHFLRVSLEQKEKDAS